MSEWRSVWRVTLKYANPNDNGGYPYRQVRAETPAQLRKIVEWARRNPAIIGFPYKRVREQYGETPRACRRGHDYDGPSSSRGRQSWTPCVCGGHMAYLCGWRGCDDIRIDPAVQVDCTISEAVAVATARTRNPRQDR